VDYSLVLDEEHKFHRLEPTPSREELSDFYESQYFELVKKSRRAPDLRALMAGGSESEEERVWRNEVVYADLLAWLEEFDCGSRVVDVGCGMGELVGFLASNGFQSLGIEPSVEAVTIARELGRNVRAATLGSFADEVRRGERERFDLVTLMNVLEHIPDPRSTLEDALSVLSEGGLLCVRVPNDFSLLQEAASAVIGHARWWVAVPDHINYFDVASLRSLIGSAGFQVVDVCGDFPMEVFLLLGRDYVSSPDEGRACHRLRISVEKQVPQEVRRELYSQLGSAGIGRNISLLARVERS